MAVVVVGRRGVVIAVRRYSLRQEFEEVWRDL